MSQDFIDGKPMLRISFAGTDFLLPWETGVQVLNLMRDAKPINKAYQEGSYETYWRPAGHSVYAESFSIAAQAALKLQGE